MVEFLQLAKLGEVGFWQLVMLVLGWFPKFAISWLVVLVLRISALERVDYSSKFRKLRWPWGLGWRFVVTLQVTIWQFIPAGTRLMSAGERLLDDFVSEICLTVNNAYGGSIRCWWLTSGADSVSLGISGLSSSWCFRLTGICWLGVIAHSESEIFQKLLQSSE
jgi:hypothetical protein